MSLTTELIDANAQIAQLKAELEGIVKQVQVNSQYIGITDVAKAIEHYKGQFEAEHAVTAMLIDQIKHLRAELERERDHAVSIFKDRETIKAELERVKIERDEARVARDFAELSIAKLEKDRAHLLMLDQPWDLRSTVSKLTEAALKTDEERRAYRVARIKQIQDDAIRWAAARCNAKAMTQTSPPAVTALVECHAEILNEWEKR